MQAINYNDIYNRADNKTDSKTNFAFLLRDFELLRMEN